MKKIFKNAMLFAGACCMTLSFTACSDSDSNDGVDPQVQNNEIKVLATQYFNSVIAPTYTNLANETETLYQNILALKKKLNNGNAVSQSEIDAICTSYKAARKYWEQSEAFLYGAASDFEIDPHIDTWPLDVNSLAKDLSNDAIEQVSKILRINHKIKEGGEDDFNIRSQQEMMETMSSTMDTLQTVLVVAAAFSLLVAGIGIMNIMLVSVTERTREIGLRMSVGARGKDISRQFLIESVMISLSGGLLGVGLGYLFTWIAKSIGFPATVPLWSVLVSFGVCACIGLVFGIIPARKAARLDPIEALRYE